MLSINPGIVSNESNSDDEYRMLRQNLFERFSTNTDAPSEEPVVPVTPVRARPAKNGGTPDRRKLII